MNKHVPEDGGTVRSSGYGLMVVKTTDSAADAEQIALSGASWCLPNAQICPALRRRRKTSAATPPNRPVKPPRACAQSARRLRGGKSSRVGKGLGHRAKQQHAQAPGQGWRAHKRGERGGAESPVMAVVAATAAGAATQSHLTSTLPNRTQG